MNSPSLSRTSSFQSAVTDISTANPGASDAAAHKKSGAPGAVLASAFGGFAGLSMGATGVAQTYRAMGLALPKGTAFLATCGTGWGPGLRAALGGASRAAASTLGPWSLYATRFPDKLADLYACMAVNFESALATRAPVAPYPPECIQLPLPNCPNPAAYRAADIAAPWAYTMVYTGVCVGLAGYTGLVAWRRFGPQDIIVRLEDMLAAGDPEKTCVANLVSKCDPCGLVKAAEIGINRSIIKLAKDRIESRQVQP